MKSIRMFAVALPILISLATYCPVAALSAEKNSKESSPAKKLPTKKATKSSIPFQPSSKNESILKTGYCTQNNIVEKRKITASECRRKGGSLHSSLAKAKKQIRPVLGYCTSKGKLISRISKDNCIRTGGNYFSSRSKANNALLKIKKTTKSSAGQIKRITGFCNSKTIDKLRTIGNVTKKRCARLGGDFFIKRFAANVDLIRKKQALSQSRLEKRAAAAAKYEKTGQTGQPVMDPTSFSKRTRKRVPSDLKTEFGVNLHDPIVDNPDYRPDWQEAPTTPTGDVDWSKVPGKGDPAGDDGILSRIMDWIDEDMDPHGGNDPPAGGGTWHMRGDGPWVRGEPPGRAWGMGLDDAVDDAVDTVVDFLGVGDDDGGGKEATGGFDTDDTTDQEPLSAGEKNEKYRRMVEAGEIEDGDQLTRGPDPEDGDPDELRSPVMEQGLAQGDGAGSGNRGGGQGQFTPPRNFGQEQHNREIHRRTKGADIDIEDGRPDEIRDTTTVAGIDRDEVAADGSTGKPVIGDNGEDGPPLPNADRSEALIGYAGQTSIMASDSAGKPVVGDDGEGGPGVPLPNAVESEIRR